jgi:murein DD-endopeptidase MepM/ murein hydrolase activator NlpD
VKKPLQTGLPLAGETLTVYAMDSLCYNPTTRDWRVHDGIDIAADAGTPVYAAAAGTVSATYEDDTMGTTVVITHEGGYVTCYSNLTEEIPVAVGELVKEGAVLGCVGSTAGAETASQPHIHFALYQNEKPLNPEDYWN